MIRRQWIIITICMMSIIGCSRQCDAYSNPYASFGDSFLKAYQEARDRRLAEQRQQAAIAAQAESIRLQREALAAQKAYNDNLVRLEQERQAEERRRTEARKLADEIQRQEREQADERQRKDEERRLADLQLKTERSDIDTKLIDPVWRKAVGDATSQQNLDRYNTISEQLGMPPMIGLPKVIEPDLSQEDLVAKASPAVVMIKHRNSGAAWSSGTGFFISKDGQIVTCAHVLEDSVKPPAKASAITPKTWVRMSDGVSLIATVVFINKKWDIALLEVDKHDAVYLAFTTDDLNQGEQVFVFGYPMGDTLGKESVVTSGIISSMRLNDAVFQLDAAVNPGNSGGPVVDRHGNVAGIAWAKLSEYEATNFAISASTIQSVLAGKSP